MKFKVARRLVSDREKVLRKLAEVEARRAESKSEFDQLAADDARVKAAEEKAAGLYTALDVLRREHEEQINRAIGACSLATQEAKAMRAATDAKHSDARARLVNLDAEEERVRGELARLDKRLPDAQARLQATAVRAQPCPRCKGAKMVPRFCALPEHASGQLHLCEEGVKPCPECTEKVSPIKLSFVKATR